MNLQPDRRLLGIDFGGTKMAIGIGDADGRLLISERVPTLASRGARQALARALDLAQKLVTDTGGTLYAAGIASPGLVRDDGIDLAPNVPGWEELRLAEAVRDHLGISRVRVANDLNAAALAELHRGALRDADPGVVIGLGTGVAAAITVNGTVVPGRHGAAGEIAYAVTGPGWPTSAEPRLEADFSGRALDELAERLSLSGGAAGLCAAARSPGPARDALVARVDELARHVVTCCLLVDPQRLVLVGGVARDELVRELLTERLSRALPYRPEVVLSGFAQDAALLGSLTLAAQA
ncbi:ROK family protein [Phytohabitans sp. ZYX-F-186]|uniref:ROK family protein n=1 Tax=Phytohabitans maris TaxID=3071409 RepID=A0ABU0ZPB0_9ACTN|nr:ROK family protein [Phytohabitans sp. ZYX-F-186]MDQ7908075.1 ROK family protein [Phytohabitans sp. ZYX-F-186]